MDANDKKLLDDLSQLTVQKKREDVIQGTEYTHADAIYSKLASIGEISKRTVRNWYGKGKNDDSKLGDKLKNIISYYILSKWQEKGEYTKIIDSEDLKNFNKEIVYYSTYKRVKDAQKNVEKKEAIKYPQEEVYVQGVFIKGAKEHSKNVKIALAVFIISSILFSALTHMKFDKYAGSFPPETPETHNVYWAHIAVILSILLILLFFPLKIKYKNEVVSRTLYQFSFGWRLLWFSWLLLYTFFIYANDNISGFGENFEVCIHIISSSIFFYLFLVLDKPSVNTKENDSRSKKFTNSLIILFVISAIVVFTSISFRYHPNTFAYSEFPIALYSGLCICFFVGRLDSHFFGEKSHGRIFGLAVLYFYPLIQVLWTVIKNTNSGSELSLLAFIVALGLKIFLFSVVLAMIHTGKIEDYIANMYDFSEKERN